MKTLLPLYAPPADDPLAWNLAAEYGRGLTVLVDAGTGDCVAGVDAGPGDGDRGLAAGLAALMRSGVRVLGRIDLRVGTRPVAAVRAEVARWAGYAVRGVFLDAAPTSPFSVGPVAVALRAARHLGLTDALLNPGMVPDDLYRHFRARICVFEGTWARLRDWSGKGARPGDGYLVYGVPPEELDAVRSLLAERQAGPVLLTDREMPDPYAELPSWCLPLAVR
ncbi:MAG TPA: spherulation-specific family 4 protein [Micromonosporaceae bacterium]